ncbi:membrane bound O-acyltransferase [Schizosaccharomyces japonicus yFS275]|uniref:Membrane bound O-acyltransferase n=1 Tax=Schizosaccharomyces japonicus (strain yFS275 / FY16936) TaxID=402676 RepID=B6K6K2_SCHJY|nr:membrane bound O-acyltransferase [Schizosaccharomyces japonicus yFS275]EEB09156.2 membrane bound O-acyltransferase [Schizosaccharomyces japonicus yFS275]
MRCIFSYEVLDGVNRHFRGLEKSPVKGNSSSSRTPSSRFSTSSNSSTKNILYKSRWNSIEFYCYYIIIAVALTACGLVMFSVSSPSHPGYYKFSKELSKGWMFGRKADVTDYQYSSFREAVILLFVLMGFYFLVKKIVLRCFSKSFGHKNVQSCYRFVFSLIFAFSAFGSGMLFVFAILLVNFSIAMIAKDSVLNPIITWTFNIIVLVCNELYTGYSFAAIHPSLAKLDHMKGILQRWHVLFNLTTLRLISFNLDYYWSLKSKETLKTFMASKERSVESLTLRERMELSREQHEYNFFNYILYLFYAPLYLAGPIITFNNFMSQLEHPFKSNVPHRNLYYGIRMVLCMVLMELLLHFAYVNAIKNYGDWGYYNQVELCMISFVLLFMTWLKLLIPWRVFRFWSLLDGIDPPENIIRCMCNNYSALGFWRAWHRSYNRWLVRYIYVPLGGKAHSLRNTFVVFTFVAFWHDLTLTLLCWGWLIVLFILPERLTVYVSYKIGLHKKPYFRIISGIGYGLNILFMIICNLVGFALGIDGSSQVLRELFLTQEGIKSLTIGWLLMYTGVQFMFEVRRGEEHQGLFLRC